MSITRQAPQLVSLPPVIVVGRGVLIIPSQAQESRYLRVLAQVTTDRDNKSLNFKYFEPRSFFGHWESRVNGYAVGFGDIGWGKTQILSIDNSAAQIQAQIHCSVENVNNNLFTVYSGLTSGVPSPVYPAIDVVTRQPPWLPRIPLDEVWFNADGNCKLAVWCDYMPLDFLCDGALGTFEPKAGDRGADKGLPNPSGSGNNGRPSGGFDEQSFPPAPSTGNGQGDENPFEVPGTSYRLLIFGSGKNSACQSFSGEFYRFGPFERMPTWSFPKDGNKGDSSQACGFSNERHVRVVVNGEDRGGANAFGLQLNPVVQRLLPGASSWV